MHWKQHVFFVNVVFKTNTIFCASFWFLFRETPLNSNSSNITLVSSHGSVDSLNFAQRWAKSSKSLRFNVAHGHVQQCCTQGNKKRKRRACRAARSHWGSWKETWDITACMQLESVHLRLVNKGTLNIYNWQMLHTFSIIFHVNVAFAVVTIVMGCANKTDWFIVHKYSRSLGGGYDKNKYFHADLQLQQPQVQFKSTFFKWNHNVVSNWELNKTRLSMSEKDAQTSSLKG